ncbi:hypothetical protein EDC01DRAFT_783400 [Geopyxis carbonaria]|nr:hypothetical protein EDC01DRAFT_783400 [Geopyxis carbonaria]
MPSGRSLPNGVVYHQRNRRNGRQNNYQNTNGRIYGGQISIPDPYQYTFYQNLPRAVPFGVQEPQPFATQIKYPHSTDPAQAPPNIFLLDANGQPFNPPLCGPYGNPHLLQISPTGALTRLPVFDPTTGLVFTPALTTPSGDIIPSPRFTHNGYPLRPLFRDVLGWPVPFVLDPTGRVLPAPHACEPDGRIPYAPPVFGMLQCHVLFYDAQFGVAAPVMYPQRHQAAPPPWAGVGATQVRDVVVVAEPVPWEVEMGMAERGMLAVVAGRSLLEFPPLPERQAPLAAAPPFRLSPTAPSFCPSFTAIREKTPPPAPIQAPINETSPPPTAPKSHTYRKPLAAVREKLPQLAPSARSSQAPLPTILEEWVSKSPRSPAEQKLLAIIRDMSPSSEPEACTNEPLSVQVTSPSSLPALSTTLPPPPSSPCPSLSPTTTTTTTSPATSRPVTPTATVLASGAPARLHYLFSNPEPLAPAHWLASDGRAITPLFLVDAAGIAHSPPFVLDARGRPMLPPCVVDSRIGAKGGMGGVKGKADEPGPMALFFGMWMQDKVQLQERIMALSMEEIVARGG